ncbi:hypothetical protein BFP76_10945 [Amylibacter kogurei]|uniref:Methyltransferase domain-containing protein n=1 Tax=Paramylibacter kogurei TaxID=1889778 RepID=A0A2G5KCM2_9RHOB|nr:class I SAM-dependent methyltransferase [Amylibacter kogurei]PIB26763.1 hypothetical protein BFP76_10945 [Amylibacter kogurei]
MNTKGKLKLALGTATDYVAPHFVENHTHTAPTGWRLNVIKAVLFSRLQHTIRAHDTSATQDAHFSFWNNITTADYFDKATNRFGLWFLGAHKPIVDKIHQLHHALPFKRVVEIGCGDGQVLNYFAQNLDGLDELIGIDINAAVLEQNRQKYADIEKIKFIAGNAEDHYDLVSQDNTLVFVYGGVLEYFSQDAVQTLFRQMLAHKNSVIAFVEPIADDHNLAQQPRSYIFGPDDSFSHNHAWLAKQVGLSVLFNEQTRTDDIRWVMCICAN